MTLMTLTFLDRDDLAAHHDADDEDLLLLLLLLLHLLLRLLHLHPTIHLDDLLRGIHLAGRKGQPPVVSLVGVGGVGEGEGERGDGGRGRKRRGMLMIN